MPLFWFSILNAPSGAPTNLHFWLACRFHGYVCTFALAWIDAPCTSKTNPPRTPSV